MAKQYRTLAPPDFLSAVESHARAIYEDARDVARDFVADRAREAHDVALARIDSVRPLSACDIIARARLGHHYIVKVRFLGVRGKEITLQNRWHKGDSGNWRILEVEDIGMRLPWVKPDKPTVTANA